MPVARPRELVAIQWMAFALAAWLLGLVAIALLEDPVSPRPYFVGGERVPRRTWLALAAPTMLASSAWLAALGVGLARRRRWARHCATGLFATVTFLAVVGGVLDLVPAGLVTRAITQCVVFGALTLWYFYRKRDVVTYFRSLPRRQRSESHLTP